MNNESEKITINLGIVELAQIDVLVEQGLYSNRSDFIRSAIRKQLDESKDYINNTLSRLAPAAILVANNSRNNIKILGICRIEKSELEAYAAVGEKMTISVIGMLSIDKNITPELFKATVAKATIRGKLIASDEIKKLIT